MAKKKIKGHVLIKPHIPQKSKKIRDKARQGSNKCIRIYSYIIPLQFQVRVLIRDIFHVQIDAI